MSTPGTRWRLQPVPSCPAVDRAATRRRASPASLRIPAWATLRPSRLTHSPTNPIHARSISMCRRACPLPPMQHAGGRGRAASGPNPFASLTDIANSQAGAFEADNDTLAFFQPQVSLPPAWSVVHPSRCARSRMSASLVSPLLTLNVRQTPPPSPPDPTQPVTATNMPTTLLYPTLTEVSDSPPPPPPPPLPPSRARGAAHRLLAFHAPTHLGCRGAKARHPRWRRCSAIWSGTRWARSRTKRP